MRNRASSHLFAIAAIIIFESIGYLAIHRGATLRGYDASWISATRDLMLYLPLIALIIWLSRVMKYKGDWTLFTSAILLFSVGTLVQYRLYSDPEYNAKNKAEAREEKTSTLRMRFINENYDATKRQMMGLPPTPPASTEQLSIKESAYSVEQALTSRQTWIPVLSMLAFAIAFSLSKRHRILTLLQKNSFLIVLLTLIPLTVAVITSSAGKALGRTTPWEPGKIPFLIGFAGILTARYKDLTRTYWGVPRARDAVPLLAMALMPFIPFFALKDFGQMIIFGGAYSTLYLVAVRRWPQLLLFVGSVVLVIGVLVVGALPRDIQEKVPTLSTLARPIQAALPNRIQQRFHLWLDGFDPPPPEIPWWKKDYMDALARDPGMNELAQQSPAMQRKVNVDIWFEKLAFQPAQALFGIASGKTTGRGLGLGFPEVIPIADSDYVYAAMSEEMGLVGGAIVLLTFFIFLIAGVRTAIEARDMFTKLSAAALTALIGFQGLANVAGMVRALPMTGITLPFVSHGGFSLVTSFAMLGMLMAFSHLNARDARAPARTKRKTVRASVLEAVQ